MAETQTSKVLNITVNATKVLAKLRVLERNYPDAVGKALYRFVEEQVATASRRRFVPVATGNLRASILTEQPTMTGTSVTVTVGAGGAAVAYAAAVHENPRAGKTGGRSPSGVKYKRWSRVGEWKYLETPAMEAAGRIDLLARAAESVLAEALRGGFI